MYTYIQTKTKRKEVLPEELGNELVDSKSLCFSLGYRYYLQALLEAARFPALVENVLQ